MIEQLLHGCPVCRQRTRHLVFCRYRPAPLAPIMRIVLLTVPFWAAVGATLGGWLGLGISLMVLGGVELVLAMFAPLARRMQLSGPEETVGELYPAPDDHSGQHGKDCRPCWLVGKTTEEILASGEWELVNVFGGTPEGKA